MEWSRVLEAVLFAATEPMEPKRLTALLKEGPEGGQGFHMHTVHPHAQVGHGARNADPLPLDHAIPQCDLRGDAGEPPNSDLDA